VHAIYLAARDPRVPWYAKALAFCVAGYAISALDLIPDFVPVLGYLDDVIVVPLGILAVVKLIPPEVMAEHRALAAAVQDRPTTMSPFDAVDGSSTGTRVPKMWALLKLPRFGGATHANGFDNRSRYREVCVSSAWR
jgi:uncharacterized membrane protein YkvA (DUF1232 family)